MDRYMDSVERLTPRAVTPEHVRGLSISETTERFGSTGLIVKLEDSLHETGLDKDALIGWSLNFALTLHADDKRTNGHYADHIMRVGLRIIDKFDINDPVIISAAFLHDAVEDHPRDISSLLGGGTDDKAPTERALFSLRTAMPDEVVELVEKLTFECNPDLTLSKNEQYYEYVEDIILTDPRARVIKLSDFIDNAVGNHFTNGNKRTKLDEKYLPLYRLHLMGLFMVDNIIPETRRLEIAKTLAKGQFRSMGRLAAIS